MLTYWLMYIAPSTLALFMPRRNQYNLITWFIVGIIFVFLIGFRYEVGGDWGTYLRHFNEMAHYTFTEAAVHKDPGYYLVTLLMYKLGWNIYGVNLISGAIFISGLIKFARKQFSPWLAFAVAVPYLTVVVTMGYTRQAAAIGFVMWAIVALDNKKFFRFLILVILAATYHKSAVLMVGIGMFGQGTGRLIRILAVGFVGIGIYEAFLSAHQEALWRNYVDVQRESQGAKIRVIMNLFPALLFFIFRKQWKKYYDDYTFWRIVALGAIVALFLVGFASTAVDRMALYMIPLQIVVFGRLPLLANNVLPAKTTTWLILLFYSLVLFVWLNFATHARFWLPYQNVLFEGIL